MLCVNDSEEMIEINLQFLELAGPPLIRFIFSLFVGPDWLNMLEHHVGSWHQQHLVKNFNSLVPLEYVAPKGIQ